MHRAIVAGTGAVVAEALRVADTHWARFRGLMGTAALPAGHGLWIRPCRQVHMFWMRYPIDVVFLNDALDVLHVEANLRPWRVSPKVAGTTTVVELPAGAAAECELSDGARLEITPAAS